MASDSGQISSDASHLHDAYITDIDITIMLGELRDKLRSVFSRKPLYLKGSSRS